MLKKNVVILGSRKTGKTTLSKKINEEHLCAIQNTENIINALRTVYPNDSEVTYKEFINNFLINYINRLSSGPDFYVSEKNVIEINSNKIDSLIDNIDFDRNIVIGLVHGNLEIDKYIENVKNTQGEYDLTRFMNEETLKKHLQDDLDNNERLTKVFEEKGIKYFDTSVDREEVLKEISNLVKENPNTLKLK